MTFEKELRVIVPLDHAEVAQYTEPVRNYVEDDNLDQIYKVTMSDEDWINPAVDERIKWDRDKSCTLDLDEELEHWQNRLHEVSTLHCNMMKKSLWCISTEVRKLLHYDGLNDVNLFLGEFEREVPEENHF